MRKLFFVLLFVLAFPLMGNAQNFIVTDTTTAKFAWNFPLSLTPPDSFTFTCNTVPVTTPIVKTGLQMPVTVMTVLNKEGEYNCSVQAVLGGVTGPASNMINVKSYAGKVVVTTN